MRGAEHVVDVLLARLRDVDLGLAATLARLEVENGPVETLMGDPPAAVEFPILDSDPPSYGFQLAPTLIAAYPRRRLEVDEHPAILVVPQGEPERRQTDVVDGAVTFHVDHTIRIFGFVRGPDHEPTGRGRDRLATATVECLAQAPKLDDDLVVEPNSTRVGRSDVDVDTEDQRSVAGFYVECVATLADVIRHAPLGSADVIAVAAHPGLE